jgi:hypothetical protein
MPTRRAAVLGLAALALVAWDAPALARGATGFHPIINWTDRQLVGATRNGVYLNPRQAARHLRGGRTYALYTLCGRAGIARAGKARADGSGAYWVGKPPLHIGAADPTLGIHARWNAQPRRPRLESLYLLRHQRVVRDFLARSGFADPVVYVTQALSVDLDGDGAEEVLIAATAPDHIKDGARGPTYSVVLLRKRVHGRMRTMTVDSNLAPREGAHGWNAEFRVAGLLDVDGDGRQEILLQWNMFEGSGMCVYKVGMTHVTRVIVSGVVE